MPGWLPHSKSLTAFRRRWRTNRDPSEILSGILPVAEVDKHWTDDRLNIWGLYAQSVGVAANRFLSVVLFTQRKEVLIYRINACLLQLGFPEAEPMHVFTPLQGYNPVLNNATFWLPWLQTGLLPGEPGHLGETFALAGDNAAFQIVVVNGAPHNCIGPVHYGPWWAALGGGAGFSRTQKLWGGDDPPLRIPPFSGVAVQTAAAVNGVNYTLDVSFYYAEREDQGRVG